MRHNTKIQKSQIKGYMKFIILTIFFFFFILSSLSVSPALAQDASVPANNSNLADNVPGQNFVEDDFKPQIEEESASWLIVKTIFVLALFIGGFYYFYKFVTQKSGFNLSGQEAIRILSTVGLGTNKFIQIIDVAGKIFLLGVTDNNINLLTEINDKEDIDRIRLLSSRSTPVQGVKFQDLITERIGWVVDKVTDIRSRGSKKQREYMEYDIEELSSKDFDMSYINKQKERLKKMNGDDE
jgi:flagellar biosynthetic protein FliO